MYRRVMIPETENPQEAKTCLYGLAFAACLGWLVDIFRSVHNVGFLVDRRICLSNNFQYCISTSIGLLHREYIMTFPFPESPEL